MSEVILIDANALKKDIDFQYICECCHNNGNTCDICPIAEIEKKIDNASPVETSKIEHKAYNEGFKDGVEQGIKLSETPGEWINQFIGGNECVMCSECKLHFDIGTNFCPNCGADMRGNK